ncbi:hypothetical protein CDV31_007333 [Fusarium ambrosium]|uniref:Zn(2)-C6 fungal-type domain-containing protein n=1 Tax=Fusarium ambrosium TaxID=131363 RepID=A0A428U796_9HYPO|nr:hypothetical protein CDV31_007333 [Fusarium ambrosium]
MQGRNMTAHDRHPSASQGKPQPRVNKSPRRATRACDDCRRLKEKCIGTVPCDRCKKSGRPCQFSNSFRRTRVSRAASTSKNCPGNRASAADSSAFFEIERIQALEQIARYYTGLEQCSLENLKEVIGNFAQDDGGLVDVEVEDGSSDGREDAMDALTPASSVHAEFSHSDFSRRVQQKVRDELDDPNYECPSPETAVEESNPSTHLLSRDAVVLEAVSLFPPAHSALILLNVFFEFAQTNYFYVDEETLRQRLDEFYSSSSRVGINDAPWVCTALMVFALGMQFAHLYQPSSRSSCGVLMREAYSVCQTMDDALALTFYRKASNMIPDILAMASLESIQAFLLLGIYVLPIDPAGLSCTYFGIAIKVATQSNMHHKSGDELSAREAELRKRVWWTAYTLERRICILHGKPVSISRLDIDANLPTDLVELQPKERVNPFQNNLAMLKLTIFMEDARDGILALKNSDKTQRVKAFQNIIKVKERLQNYWHSLPEETYCRDLTSGRPLFRSNIHLALSYHLVHISIGRSFIFDESNIKPKDAEWLGLRKELVDDCVGSAVAVIDLCQILQDKGSLSKSSYTEFSSCCAAVLALVAKAVSDKSGQLQDASKRGMELLRNMSTGVFSTSCEKRAVEGLEAAFDRLNHKEDDSAKCDEAGYMQFRDWVAMQQILPTEALQLPKQDNPMMNLFGGSSVGSHYSAKTNGCSLPGYAELSSLPDLGEWFDHGFGQGV